MNNNEMNNNEMNINEFNNEMNNNEMNNNEIEIPKEESIYNLNLNPNNGSMIADHIIVNENEMIVNNNNCNNNNNELDLYKNHNISDISDTNVNNGSMITDGNEDEEE
eukprot:43334_1